MTIEHVSLHVTSPKKSRAFYQTVLKVLGYRIQYDLEQSTGFFANGHTDFWISKAKVGAPTHLAFRAASRARVDAFYAAAVAAGAKDNGGPGLRAENGPNYYACFVFDPDGHNIEAVCFAKSNKKAGAKTK